MTFFFDNNFGPGIPHGLGEFGEDVIHLTDMFSADTEDAVWLRHIGREGKTLITKDRSILRNPAEIKAIKDFKVGGFVLSHNHLPVCIQVQIIIKQWPHIKELAQKSKPPYIYSIPEKGKKFKKIL